MIGPRIMTAKALAVLLFALAAPATAQRGDVPASFFVPSEDFDHTRWEVMIPMRDGVKLHTVIVTPKNRTEPSPIVLTRTPYGASRSTNQANSPRVAMVLPPADESLLKAGYVRVYQDIRGRHDSEGDWILTIPPRGPLNARGTDETTDTYDTIDWLVKSVPGNNGRVGLTGVSYPGWLTLMGILQPHPALKAAVPMYPMVDGWIGDDFYHNGALRQTMFEWIYRMSTSKNSRHHVPFGYRDMYEAYLSTGGANDVARRYGGAHLPAWRRIVDNPAYNAFWQGQAVQDMLEKAGSKLPVMLVHGLFDQEDSFGGIAAYEALERHDFGNDMIFLALGPWSHGQSQRNGSSLGAMDWNSDTSHWFRERILLPFWDQHLKERIPATATPPVLAFETGSNEWRTYEKWPADGMVTQTPLYLRAGGKLSFHHSASSASLYAEYMSDPLKPVPYRVRPILSMYDPESTWRSWLVDDQRPFSDRPDVLTFVTDPLERPIRVSGEVVAHLVASTTGSDADWVVKLIDAYPPEVAANPALGGFQLMVSGDIMRGRYRKSTSAPQPIAPNKRQTFRVRLPQVSHTFKAGHRIMVQIQSSWFPLYDRNPQTFVPNVAEAHATDYKVATHRIWLGAGGPTFIELPVVMEQTRGR